MRGACLDSARPRRHCKGSRMREQAGHLLRPTPKATTVWAMSPTQDLPGARKRSQSSYTITENHHAPFPTPLYVPTCRQNCESSSCWRGCPDLQGVCTKCATWRMKELQRQAQTLLVRSSNTTHDHT